MAARGGRDNDEYMRGLLKSRLRETFERLKVETVADSQRRMARGLGDDLERQHDVADVMWGLDVVPVLAHALRTWTDNTAKNHVCRMVCLLCLGTTARQNEMVEAGLLELLVAFVWHVDRDGWAAYAWEEEDHDPKPLSLAAGALRALTFQNRWAQERLRSVPGVIEELQAAKDRDCAAADTVLVRLRSLPPPAASAPAAAAASAPGESASAAAAAAAAGGGDGGDGSAGTAASPSSSLSPAAAAAGAAAVAHVAAAATALTEVELEGLVAAVCDATDTDARRRAASALSAAADAPANRRVLMERTAAVPVLVAALTDWDDQEAKGHCALAAGRLISTLESVPSQAALVEAGILAPLVELVPYVDRSSGRVPAVWTLRRLTDANDAVRQTLRQDLGVIEALKAVAPKDTSGDVRVLLTRLQE